MSMKRYVPFVLAAAALLISGCQHKTERTLQLMSETPYAIDYTIFESGRPGSRVAVIAGIHGNEPAGTGAAESIDDSILDRGTLLVIPRANAAACQAHVRSTWDMSDMNRAFSGDSAEYNTSVAAKAVVELLESYEPDIILDLHESSGDYGRDGLNLGHSIIFGGAQGPEATAYVLSDMDTALFSQPWTYENAAPEGSLNQVMSQCYGRTVLTVETDMTEDMAVRIAQQRELIEGVLRFLRMKG